MATIEEILNALFYSPVADWYTSTTGGGGIDAGQYGHLIGGTPTPERKAQAQMLLIGSGIALGAIVGGGLLATYGHRKLRKTQANASERLESAANRGADIAKAIITNKTVMAPLSYLYVQAFEDAGVIPGAYGDAYQAILSAMVGADLASAIGKVVPF